MQQAELTIPAEVNEHYLEVYKRLVLLKQKGFYPDFVLDVGASTGCWSFHSRLVFPNTRYILIEPLPDFYRQRPYWLAESYPEFELVSKAVSDRPGTLVLNVSSDLCSSSVFGLHPTQFEQRLEVEATTLDLIAADKQLKGRGLAKLDIQFAEHLALAGASQVFKLLDVVIMELSMLRTYPESKTFLEMIELMDGIGFRYFDDAGEHRRQDGILIHKDVVFVRNGVVV